MIKRLILGGWIVLMFSCQVDQERVKKARRGPEVPDQVGELVTIHYKDSGALKATLRSPRVEYFLQGEPRILMPKGIRVDFYLQDKKTPHSKLEAGWGLRYEKLHRTELRNNVVVVNLDHDTLQTEELTWDESTHKIYSSKFVKVKKKNEIIFGDGFESDEDLTNYKIFNIKGTIYRDRGTFE